MIWEKECVWRHTLLVGGGKGRERRREETQEKHLDTHTHTHREREREREDTVRLWCGWGEYIREKDRATTAAAARAGFIPPFLLVLVVSREWSTP